MDTLSYKTKSAKPAEVQHDWYIIDAESQILGRMASKIAHVLRGKHKPSYTPHVDCGDNVIVINAEKVRLTGKKMDNKIYSTYSGYPGGQKTINARDLLAKKPTDLVENAVRNMLPKSKLGRAMFRKLYVYAGGEHPHQGQQPQEFKF